MTNSKSLFDVSTKATTTTKEKLFTDLITVKNAYYSLEVNDDALMTSEFNIADALTIVKTDSILLDTIQYGKIDRPVAQLIMRTKTDEVMAEIRTGV